MRRLLAALMLALAPVTAAAPAAEAPVTIAGTRITLAPPPGFEPSTKFVGLNAKQLGASFNVSEALSSAYPSVVKSVTQPGELRQRGLRLVETETLPGFPYEHVVTHATRQQEGVTIDVWLLVFRHAEITGTVVASLGRIPNPPATAEAMRAALASVRVAAQPPGSLTAQLPFAVDAPARFTYRRALAGRQLMLKESPPAPEGAVGDVVATVTQVSRDPVKPPERDRFARQQMFALTAIQVDSADDPVPVTIGGVPGLEMMGQGRTAAGHPRRVYQVVLFAPRATYVIVALALPNRFEQAQADIRALAHSFKAKP
ncbi:MAG: hypothetical protein IT562_04095 [Alphaproteobacteria bacterium]|nr:hypothetical protein [Alphaproteobacteria bacterium]